MDGGEPVLILTEKGPTVRLRDITLYPAEDPVGYAARRAAAVAVQPRTLVYVPSVGLGHGLAVLLDRLPEGSAVLCVETEPGIMALAAARGLPRDPRLTVVRTADPSAAAAALDRMGTGRFRRVVRVTLCAGYRLDPGTYQAVQDALSAEIRTFWQNRLTLIAMGSLWVRNLFDNLRILPQARDISILSTPLPVVVAGAGPSLERSLPALRAARGRYTLVAVDTALPVLAAGSLLPDLVVVLEAQAVNLQDFLPFRGPPLAVAFDLASHPSVPRLFAGRLFCYSSAFAPLSMFTRMADRGILPARFPPLGSVGVAAVRAALGLTRRSVYLTGLDFSYPGGKTHACGTPAHIAMLTRCGRLRAVGQEAFSAVLGRPRVTQVDKHGVPVTTDLVLGSYREQLQRLLAPETGRARDAGQTGLPLGVEMVAEADLEGLLCSGAAVGERLVAADGGEFPAGRVAAFLAEESRLLETARDRLEAMAGRAPAGLPENERAALSVVEHAFIHFPDSQERTGASFLARSLVSVSYYAQRLARLRGSFSPQRS
jgi:hypothetical protein